MSEVPVTEIFGPTIQGEGPMVGMKTHFVRFSGCDYRCSWCDTPYSLKASHGVYMSFEDIVKGLNALPPAPWVVLSGGNPLLWDLDGLVDRLHLNFYKVSVETQGSLYKAWVKHCDLVVVSPKPPSSREELTPRRRKNLEAFLGLPNVALKVVIFDDVDLEFARQLHISHPDIPFTLQVGRDPQVETELSYLEKYRWLVGRVLADPTFQGCRVLPQVHFLLWGNRRGV